MEKKDYRKALEVALRSKYRLRGARLNFNSQWSKGYETIVLFEAWRTNELKGEGWRTAFKFELTPDEIKKALSA